MFAPDPLTGNYFNPKPRTTYDPEGCSYRSDTYAPGRSSDIPHPVTPPHIDPPPVEEDPNRALGIHRGQWPDGGVPTGEQITADPLIIMDDGGTGAFPHVRGDFDEAGSRSSSNQFPNPESEQRWYWVAYPQSFGIGQHTVQGFPAGLDPNENLAYASFTFEGTAYYVFKFILAQSGDFTTEAGNPWAVS